MEGKKVGIIGVAALALGVGLSAYHGQEDHDKAEAAAEAKEDPSTDEKLEKSPEVDAQVAETHGQALKLPGKLPELHLTEEQQKAAEKEKLIAKRIEEVLQKIHTKAPPLQQGIIWEGDVEQSEEIIANMPKFQQLVKVLATAFPNQRFIIKNIEDTDPSEYMVTFASPPLFDEYLNENVDEKLRVYISSLSISILDNGAIRISGSDHTEECSLEELVTKIDEAFKRDCLNDLQGLKEAE